MGNWFYSILIATYSWIFKHFINSPNSWLRMKGFHTNLLKYKSSNKSRFNLNVVKLTASPKENGILPHIEEQLLEYPNHGRNERILIYGTNSFSDVIIIRLETRFIKSDSLIRGSIILKRGTTMYTFDEIDWNSTDFINKYRIKGLTVEVISPLRKLRITFRGIMNCASQGSSAKELFIKFNFFWTPFSGAIDGKHSFDCKFLAKDLSETCSRNLGSKVNLIDMLEDRYEQYGQLIGLISIDNQPDEEVFLWGSRYKIFIQDQDLTSSRSSSQEQTDDNDSTSNVLGPCQSMRLLAMSTIYGPAISVGYVSNSKCSYRYGSAFTVPPLAWTMTSTSICGQDLDQLLHLESDGKVRSYSLQAKGKRNFDMRITKLERLSSDIVLGTIELKGYEANCILIDERNGLLYDHIPSWLKPIPKLMSLEVAKVLPKTFEEYIYSLADVSGGHESTSGGKGSSLIVLTEIASSFQAVPFKVPRGLIVSTKSYKFLLENDETLRSLILELQKKVWNSNGQQRGKKIDYEEESQNVINKFKSCKLPDLVTEHLRRKMHRIFGNFEELYFSVRSSAVGEDGEEMSAAGQMDTFLGVKGIESITNCIMKCWASQFTAIALNYRSNYGQLIDVNMSVVIQEMVNCDAAGVMFTIDPVTGNEQSIVITSNYGLGESVVSGSAEPDTIKLDVNLKERSVERISSKVIGSKSMQIKLFSEATKEPTKEKDGEANEEDKEKEEAAAAEKAMAKEETEKEKEEKEGTESLLVEKDKSSVCSISDEEAIKLGRIGLMLHDIWRCPRDIEWGIKDGVIYLFQSRPVTNLERFNQWELMHEMDSAQPTETEYVTRANVGEVLPGAMSHLCHSFIIAGWGVPGFARFKYIMGAQDDMFVPYILSFFAVVNNTFFINLKNKHFAFGTEEGAGTEYALLGHRLTDEKYLQTVTEYYAMDPKNTSRWANTKVLLFVFKEALMAKKRLEKFVKKFKDFQLIKPDQKFASSEEILNHILDNSWQNSYGMLLHGQVTQTSILASQILRVMLSKSNPDVDSVLLDMSNILSTCSDVVSAGVPAAIESIINVIDDPEYFKSLSDQEALTYLTENEKTSKMFKDLVDDYGHRGVKEFDLLTKTWGMDPMPLVKSLKASSRTVNQRSNQEKGSKKEPTIDETLDSLNTKTTGSLRKILKHVVIPFTRGSVGWRERSKSFTIWMIHKYRIAFWLLADQMSRVEGRIPDPELLFHLKLEEIAILVKERNPTIVDKAIKRRKCLKAMDKLKFDEITVGPNIKPRSEVAPTTTDGKVSMKGTPVCAGKIEARVCVAMSVEDASDIQEGDILITYCTDIGWSPLFPLLSGLATEIGGLVSHGAVIAREYGLPCLVGVEGAPSLFKTGDRALLDSVNGIITKL